MNYAAFFSYIFVTSITPGPNNIMALSNAGKYGFKGAMPYNFGALCGVFVVISCCAAFSAALYDFIPAIEPVMCCLGALYILWLAVSLWLDKPRKSGKNPLRSNSFFSGLLLQFVNAKAFMYAITSISSFVLPYYRDFWHVLLFVVIMSLTCLVCTSCWALFGSAFERFFRQHGRLLNLVMSLLLVYCAVSMVWGIF